MSGYLSPAPPRVLAHRGLAVDALGAVVAPENTLLAFERALAVGVTHLETDVHASRDGIAVIAHDLDLRRLAGLAAQLRSLTAAELAAVDLGHGQGFCSLAEALAAFPTARFNIDVKAVDAVAPTARAVREAGATERVLITSFSEARRLATVRSLPGVATSIGAARALPVLYAAAAGAVSPLRRLLSGIAAVQLPERAAGVTVSAPRVLRALHAAGVEVHIWTVNDPADMARLFDAGIDGIVTDRADLAMAVLADRGK